MLTNLAKMQAGTNVPQKYRLSRALAGVGRLKQTVTKRSISFIRSATKLMCLLLTCCLAMRPKDLEPSTKESEVQDAVEQWFGGKNSLSRELRKQKQEEREKRKLEAKKERDVSQAVEAWASGSKVIKNPKARRSGKFGRDLKNKMERKESPKEAEHPVEKVMDAVDSWFGDTSWRSRGRSPAARETKERAAVPTAHKTKGHKRTLSGK